MSKVKKDVTLWDFDYETVYETKQKKASPDTEALTKIAETNVEGNDKLKIVVYLPHNARDIPS